MYSVSLRDRCHEAFKRRGGKLAYRTGAARRARQARSGSRARGEDPLDDGGSEMNSSVPLTQHVTVGSLMLDRTGAWSGSIQGNER